MSMPMLETRSRVLAPPRVGDLVTFLATFDQKDPPEDPEFLPPIPVGTVGKVAAVTAGKVKIEVGVPWSPDTERGEPRRFSVTLTMKGGQFRSWNGVEARIGPYQRANQWLRPEGWSKYAEAGFESQADPVLAK